MTASTIAAASIAVAVLVMAAKYAAFAATGSVALYSDALESIVNVITATVALYTIRLGAKPADSNHPFGHHKAELFSVILEGALIIVAALMIIAAAYEALVAPRALDRPLTGLAIGTVASLINAGWAAVLIRLGGRLRSPALVADGWHVVSDVVTSAGVLAGLVLVAVTGWAILDPLLALAVAAYILWTGYRLVAGSIGGLMDEAAPADVQSAIRAAIQASGSGALEAHDIRTRSAGAVTFVELHLVVPGTMTVAQSHLICDRIEEAVRDAIPGARTVVHVEPENKMKSVAGGALPI